MIQLKVNGADQSFNGEPEMPLLWYLRDVLGLTGSKFGCGVGLCGACTVHVNRQATRSCVTVMRDTAGKEVWRYTGPKPNPYQVEHDVLFAAIRAGKPINNGEYMCQSTLMAIMGRMATYTGQQITWEQALASREDLSPPRYDWAVQLPDPPVAIPGLTRFV